MTKASIWIWHLTVNTKTTTMMAMMMILLWNGKSSARFDLSKSGSSSYCQFRGQLDVTAIKILLVYRVKSERPRNLMQFMKRDVYLLTQKSYFVGSTGKAHAFVNGRSECCQKLVCSLFVWYCSKWYSCQSFASCNKAKHPAGDDKWWPWWHSIWRCHCRIRSN